MYGMKEGVNGQVDEQFEGRIPPQNLDAEQSVLGAILLDPDSIVSVMEFLIPDDFYRVNHQVIFKAMVELNNDSSPIDIVSVAERLNQNKQLENAGGQLYLLELAEKVRSELPHLNTMLHCSGGNFKKQFKRADKSGATLALVIGESEVQNKQVVVKHLQGGADQQTLDLVNVIDYIQTQF